VVTRRETQMPMANCTTMNAAIPQSSGVIDEAW
jgi:hypothetical protein